MAGKMGTAVVQCLYNHPQGSTVCSRTHLTMTWANTVRPYGYTSANEFTNDVLIQPPR